MFEEFEKALRQSSKKDVVNDNFSKQTTQMFEEKIAMFKKKSADLIIENSGWGD